MAESPRTAYPRWAYFSAAIPTIAMVGATGAIACAWVYGLPSHAVVGFAVMAFATGVGITAGLHRFFSHRSFATFRAGGWGLEVLGAVSGQPSGFFRAGTYRRHQHFSDGNWCLIWTMEPLGLAWNVRRPRLQSAPVGDPHEAAV